MALVAHALTFLEGGIVGPLILYFIKRKDSPFVAFHALQSVYFGLLFLVAFFVTLVTCVGPFVCMIAYWVYEIIACVKANEGVWYKLPVVGQWAMNAHPIPPVYPDWPAPPPHGGHAPPAGAYHESTDPLKATHIP